MDTVPPAALTAWISDRLSPFPNGPHPNNVRALAENDCPGVVMTVLKSLTELMSDKPEPEAYASEGPAEKVFVDSCRTPRFRSPDIPSRCATPATTTTATSDSS